jgi:ABC-type bacteriocin/lantibiotic exporter with double-glycine peptidase domain
MVNENWKLRHKIKKPISPHTPSFTKNAQIIIGTISIIFLIVLFCLVWLELKLLRGAPKILLFSILILPISALILLLALFYFRKAIKKEIEYLKEKHPFEFEHGVFGKTKGPVQK